MTQKIKLALGIGTSVFKEFIKGLSLNDEVFAKENLIVVDFSKENVWNNFCDLQAQLKERKDCECDASFLQIIPYVVLHDAQEPSLIYHYQRGSGSGEKRLINRSIGFGGHIEEDKPIGRAIVDCVIRELDEELGITVDEERVISSLEGAIAFHDISNDVGKVHLCVLIHTFINKTDFILERNVIEDLQLSSCDSLITSIKSGEMTFESWSMIALGCDERIK